MIWDPGGEPEGKDPELETNEVPLSDTEWESAAPENINPGSETDK